MLNTDTKNVVILISGNGTNAQAIIEACKDGSVSGNVVAVISNKANAYGLERARKLNVDAITVEHKLFADREAFDMGLIKAIDPYEPDLIVLAGFMRILTPKFVNTYAGKLINIHPSLLPKYPGLNTHERALKAADKWHGASVHFVTEELDGGPIILKSQVLIEPDDNVQSLAGRVAKKEWLIYPLVVRWFCDNKVKLCENNVVYKDQTLSRTGLIYEDL